MQTNEELVQEAAMLQYNIKNEFNFIINKNTKLQLIQDATTRLGQIFSQLNDIYNSPKIEIGDTVNWDEKDDYLVKNIWGKEVEIYGVGWVDLGTCTLISKKIKQQL